MSAHRTLVNGCTAVGFKMCRSRASQGTGLPVRITKSSTCSPEWHRTLVAGNSGLGACGRPVHWRGLVGGGRTHTWSRTCVHALVHNEARRYEHHQRRDVVVQASTAQGLRVVFSIGFVLHELFAIGARCGAPVRATARRGGRLLFVEADVVRGGGRLTGR